MRLDAIDFHSLLNRPFREFVMNIHHPVQNLSRAVHLEVRTSFENLVKR
jgi:hypothetical protein